MECCCFLHLKTAPVNTQSVNLNELWDIINPFLDSVAFSGTDENYYSAIIRIANSCVADNSNDVLLDNKLVIAIAIRFEPLIDISDWSLKELFSKVMEL